MATPGVPCVEVMLLHRRAVPFVFPLVVTVAVASCRKHAPGDVSPTTMVPNPVEGASPAMGPGVTLGMGACQRYVLCCQQVASSGPAVAASVTACAPITTPTTAAPTEPMCMAQMAGVTTQLRAAALVVPSVCEAVLPTAPTGTGGLSLFGGSLWSGSGGGSGAGWITVGAVRTGTFATGDPTETDGSLYHDYSISLVAGSAVTIVARGGVMTGSSSGPAGSGSTLDMYLHLQLHGADVATDDDSAGNLNSRIVFMPVTSGTYTIRVTTFGTGARYGTFTLQTYAGSLPSQT